MNGYAIDALGRLQHPSAIINLATLMADKREAEPNRAKAANALLDYWTSARSLTPGELAAAHPRVAQLRAFVDESLTEKPKPTAERLLSQSERLLAFLTAAKNTGE